LDPARWIDLRGAGPATQRQRREDDPSQSDSGIQLERAREIEGAEAAHGPSRSTRGASDTGGGFEHAEAYRKPVHGGEANHEGNEEQGQTRESPAVEPQRTTREIRCRLVQEGTRSSKEHPTLRSYRLSGNKPHPREGRSLSQKLDVNKRLAFGQSAAVGLTASRVD
jgi:hypothetical protein